MEPLSELERDVLMFERQWWKYAGAKIAAIRETFDMSDTRYHQIVNQLIDKPAAMEQDPLVVHQLRRQREQRRHRPTRDRLRRDQSA